MAMNLTTQVLMVFTSLIHLVAHSLLQVRSIAMVTTAVAHGDLSKQIEVDARGEILELKSTVNGMVVRFVLSFPSALLLFKVR